MVNMLDDDIFFNVVCVNRVGCGVMIDIIFKLDIIFLRYFVTLSIIRAVRLRIF